MALRDKQISMVELGRVRCGQRVSTRSGAMRPDKLDRFKFTSAIEHLIVEIAALYGGEPGPYSGEGVRGKQFQVVTDTNIIPVYLPQQKIDPFYEKWGNGACMRRCDGIHDTIHDKPCDCDPDGRTCKPTTRLNVMLADVPGLGFWRLETHSLYAAMEMSQLATLLSAVNMPLPGRLLLESRARKFFNRAEGKVETRDYYVPIVVIDSVTARQIQVGGDALTQAIQMSNATAVGSAPAVRAIEAAPASTPTAPAAPDPEAIKRGLARIATAEPGQMPALHARIKQMGSPQALVDAFQARLGEHALAEAAVSKELEASWPEGEGDGIVEAAAVDDEGGAERAVTQGSAIDGSAAGADVAALDAAPVVEDKADRGRALMELLGVAGELKLNTKQIDDKIFARFVVERSAATAAQFRELAASLRDGDR